MSVQRLKALPGFCTQTPRPRRALVHIPTSPVETGVKEWIAENIRVTAPLRTTVGWQERKELGVEAPGGRQSWGGRGQLARPHHRAGPAHLATAKSERTVPALVAGCLGDVNNSP